MHNSGIEEPGASREWTGAWGLQSGALLGHGVGASVGSPCNLTLFMSMSPLNLRKLSSPEKGRGERTPQMIEDRGF